MRGKAGFHTKATHFLGSPAFFKAGKGENPVGIRGNPRTRYGEIPVVGEGGIGEIAGTIRVY